MLYYRVKKEYDNAPRYRLRASRQLVHDGALIVNELYTKKELAKFTISPAALEAVEISQKKTFFFFGARFAD